MSAVKRRFSQLVAAAQRTRAGRALGGWLARAGTLLGPAAGSEPVDGQAGQFVAGGWAHEAGRRGYKLYVPTGYPKQRLALVVMLHGCHQSAESFASGTRMNALAEERQCFVLYPEQAKAANASRCWNWFKPDHQRRDGGEPAILAGMTREVVRRYGIDPDRVYIAGLSAGGSMAAVMGTVYPDIFAAVGVHSGLACGSAHDLASALAAMRGAPGVQAAAGGAAAVPPVPTIVFHGDRDRTVHPRNGERWLGASSSAADAQVEHAQAPGGHAYTRAIRRNPAGRAVLEYWQVHGGGHAWFGGSLRGSYADPKGPDASREMMRFFWQSDAERAYARTMGRWAA
jgi:poly(hydroxyalkanoate) depolymerase family esterase